MNAIIEELLTAYTELSRFLSRRLRNPHDAADVAQSSFERVYTHALAAPIAAPRALLFRTAQRICIDRARHDAVVRGWVEEHSTFIADAVVPSVEHSVMQRQLMELVSRRLKAMPPRRRQVFLLFRAYGYSRQEIATRLGITDAAVAKHVVRATLECARCFAALKND
ncbi:MAG: sigma-70 family RNA polymerase sigma factor [Candidatus Binatia bacterium]